MRSGLERLRELRILRGLRQKGARVWEVNGQLHRDDGPAIMDKDGEAWWFVGGQRHRVDGPAVVKGAHRSWWLHNWHFPPPGSTVLDVLFDAGVPIDEMLIRSAGVWVSGLGAYPGATDTSEGKGEARLSAANGGRGMRSRSSSD